MRQSMPDICRVDKTRPQTSPPAKTHQCFRYRGHRPAVRLRAVPNVAQQQRFKALRRVGAGEPVDIKQRFAKWAIHFRGHCDVAFAYRIIFNVKRLPRSEREM